MDKVRNQQKGKRIPLQVIAGLCLIFISITGVITCKYSEQHQLEKFRKIAGTRKTEISIPEIPASAEEKTVTFTYDWHSLNDINADIKGWLYLPDTPINFPVVGTAGQIGNFHGFALMASYDSFNLRYLLNIKGCLSHQIEVGKDPLGNMLRISNVLTGMEKKLSETEAKLTNVRHQLATAQEEIKKPFAREEELKEKLKRLSELNILLNMDDKGSSEAIALDEDAGEEKPSVLGKLKAAKERIGESQKDGKKAVKGEEQEL